MSAQLSFVAADINTILTKSAVSVSAIANNSDISISFKNASGSVVYVATIPFATSTSAGVISADDYTSFKSYDNRIRSVENSVSELPSIVDSASAAIHTDSLFLQFTSGSKICYSVEIPVVSQSHSGIVGNSDYSVIKTAPLLLSAAKVEGVEKVQSRGGNTKGVYVFDVYDNTLCIFVEGSYVKAWSEKQDPNGLGSSAYARDRVLINVEGSLYARYNDKWIPVGSDSNIKVMPQSEYESLPSSSKNEKTIYMTY